MGEAGSEKNCLLFFLLLLFHCLLRGYFYIPLYKGFFKVRIWCMLTSPCPPNPCSSHITPQFLSILAWSYASIWVMSELRWPSIFLALCFHMPANAVVVQAYAEICWCFWNIGLGYTYSWLYKWVCIKANMIIIWKVIFVKRCILISIILGHCPAKVEQALCFTDLTGIILHALNSVETNRILKVYTFVQIVHLI